MAKFIVPTGKALWVSNSLNSFLLNLSDALFEFLWAFVLYISSIIWSWWNFLNSEEWEFDCWRKSCLYKLRAWVWCGLPVIEVVDCCRTLLWKCSWNKIWRWRHLKSSKWRYPVLLLWPRFACPNAQVSCFATLSTYRTLSSKLVKKVDLETGSGRDVNYLQQHKFINLQSSYGYSGYCFRDGYLYSGWLSLLNFEVYIINLLALWRLQLWEDYDIQTLSSLWEQLQNLPTYLSLLNFAQGKFHIYSVRQ